jgi:hypothetical protein
MVRCEECRCVASDADEAWVTYLHADDEEQPDEVWYFVSYCPSCASGGSGSSRGRATSDGWG